MALSHQERERIVSALDAVENVMAQAIIASIESFAAWLSRELPVIFRKIGQELSRLWQAIKAAFR